MLGQALGRLFAVAEAYPELQATRTSASSRSSCAETENRIAVSRQVYNDTVLTYNNAIQVFPAVLVAGLVRLHDASSSRWRTRPREAPASPSSPPRRRPLRAAAAPPAAMHPRLRALASLLAAALALCARGNGRQVVHPPAGDVAVQVAADGGLVVAENITFAFGGRSAAAIATSRSARARRRPVSVSGRTAPTAPARAPSSAAARAGTYGAERRNGCRIVWHYQALERGPHVPVRYRLRGVAVAYDDVVDVNLQVWGDEWEVRSAG